MQDAGSASSGLAGEHHQTGNTELQMMIRLINFFCDISIYPIQIICFDGSLESSFPDNRSQHRSLLRDKKVGI